MGKDGQPCPATALPRTVEDGYPVHLSLVEIVVNVVFKVVPIDVTATMITIERLPAMIAYSMEVAPPSSL